MSEGFTDGEIADDISDKRSDEVEIFLANRRRRVNYKSQVHGNIIFAGNKTVEDAKLQPVNKLVHQLDQIIFKKWHQTDKFKRNGVAVVDDLN